MLKDPRLEITHVDFNEITFLILLQLLTLLIGLGNTEVAYVCQKKYSIISRLAILDNVDRHQTRRLDMQWLIYRIGFR